MVATEKTFERLGDLLSRLFYDSYAAHPEFCQMVGGCRNLHLPAIKRGLAKLVSRHAGALPLKEREYLYKLNGALEKKRLKEALFYAVKANNYSHQLGFASVADHR